MIPKSSQLTCILALIALLVGPFIISSAAIDAVFTFDDDIPRRYLTNALGPHDPLGSGPLELCAKDPPPVALPWVLAHGASRRI